MTTWIRDALTLLAFGTANFLIDLIVWSGIFTLTTIAAGVPIARWSMARLRNSKPVGSPPVSQAALWGARIWLTCVVFIGPTVGALFHAVPFAVQRNLATLLEEATPVGVSWITDLAASGSASTLGISSDTTIVDVAALRLRVTETAERMVLAGRSTWGTGRLRSLAERAFLKAIELTLDQVSPEERQLTWADIVRRSKVMMKARAKDLLATVVIGLRASAWLHVAMTLLIVAACNLMTWAGFLLITPAKPTATALTG